MFAHGYVLDRHCSTFQLCVPVVVWAVIHNAFIRGEALFQGSVHSICGASSSPLWTLKGALPWRCLAETIREVAWVDRLVRMFCGNLPQQFSP
jgi:hypothetical protein